MPDRGGFEGEVGRVGLRRGVVADEHHAVEGGVVAGDLAGEVFGEVGGAVHDGGFEVGGLEPDGVEAGDARFGEGLHGVEEVGDVAIVVAFFLLVGDVEGHEVEVLCVLHVRHLGLVGDLRFLGGVV